MNYMPEGVKQKAVRAVEQESGARSETGPSGARGGARSETGPNGELIVDQHQGDKRMNNSDHPVRLHPTRGILPGHAGWPERLARPGLALGLAGLLLAAFLTLAAPGGAAQGAPPEQPVGTDEAAQPLTLAWLSQDASATTGAAWGDVDGDGDLDLAVSNVNGPSRLTINVGGTLRSDAPGAWTSAESDASSALAWGDVDGDGDLDLVVANSVRCQATTTQLGTQTRCTPGLERLYENVRGQLTRQAVWSSRQADDSRALALGDADGDGDLDLAVANVLPERGCSAGQPCPLAANRLYRNEGGRFSQEAIWTSADMEDSMALVWVNLDDDPALELVVGGQSGVAFYDNGPTGLARTATPLAATEGAVIDLAVGDVTGDGRPDVVAAGGREPRRLWLISREPGSESWQSSWTMTTTQSIQSLALGDLDADGREDLAVGSDCAASRSQCRLRVYPNQGGRIAAQESWQSQDSFNAAGLAWGDVDGDGDLDLAVGAGNASNQPNRLYRNTSQPLAAAQVLPQSGDGAPVSAAWADVDGDQDLDLALGFSRQCSTSPTPCTPGQLWLYLNQQGALERQPIDPAQSSADGAWGDVRTLAWGDYDRDGDPDLAAGSAASCAITGGVTNCRWVGLGGRSLIRTYSCQLEGGQPQCSNGGVRLFRNDQGVLSAGATWQGLSEETISSLVWGDVDGDGFLDLAVGAGESCGRDAQGNLICRDGVARVLPNVSQTLTGTQAAAPARGLSADAVWRVPAPQDTSALAWGDVDNDGDLDLLVADRRQRLRLYVNRGGVLDAQPSWESEQTAETRNLAWGDYDGDGDLDLAVSNQDEAVHLYRNQGGRLSASATWTARETNRNARLAWGDVDNDGDLDLAINGDQAARLYLNDNGLLDPNAAWTETKRSGGGVAWGDANRDGAADLLAGGVLFRNLLGERLAAAGAPRLAVQTPAGGVGSGPPALISPQTEVTVTFTLSNGAPGRLADVRAFYSLNGPGAWLPATPAAGVQSAALGSGQHLFVWDTAADGLMGRSDNAVLRLTAAARPLVQPNTAAERASIGASGAATGPFPVRGAQVRVLDQASGQPAAGALVFRLPAGQVAGARPLGSSRGPYRTDINGFLQGRGQIDADDTLVALLPITRTRTVTTAYTLFHTSAEPISTTIAASTVVSGALLRELFISPDNPLLLFDLNVSLEWDATGDPDFLLQLEEAFQRSSEVLYDLSNGQMALGRVRVFQNKEQWLTSDVQIYASNRVRPRASMGGIVQRALDEQDRDGVQIAKAYNPGAIRIGPVWDPFGQSRADLGRDWWRAFAHELGHHLLFLPDNYLGYHTAADGSIVDVISVDCAGSVMTTAYDDAYSEFADFGAARFYSQGADGETVAEWPGECRDTLAAHTTKFSDWEMIQRHYPMVNRPDERVNPGPAALPLAVTQVQFVQPAGGGAALPARFFDLRNAADGGRMSVAQGQTFLFQSHGTPDLSDDTVIALGVTGRSDSIKVRGATEGDRVCVFDNSGDAALIGCAEDVSALSTSIPIASVEGWQPNVQVRPVMVPTLLISVTQAAGPAGPAIAVTALDGQGRAAVQQMPELGLATVRWMPEAGGGQGFTVVLSGTKSLSTTVPALDAWLFRGGSVAIATSQPAAPGQAASIQIARPGLAITVTQPISADQRLLTQILPGYQLGSQAFAPVAVAAPLAGDGDERLRAQVTLDYPAYTGMVRTWLENAASGGEQGAWLHDRREAVSRFYLQASRAPDGAYTWGDATVTLTPSWPRKLALVRTLARRRHGQPDDGLVGALTLEQLIARIDPLGLRTDDRALLGTDDRALLGTDDRALLGADDRALLGADDRALLGTDDRALLGADDRALLGTDDRALLGTDDRALLGTDDRALLGVDYWAGLWTDDRALLGTDDRALLGTDDRALLGTDDRGLLWTDDRALLGTDDRALLGADDRALLGTDDRALLGTDDRALLGTDDRALLGADVRGLYANSRALGAPMSSEDGGVTIFNRTDALTGDTGVESLEALPKPPGLPAWLTPVGQAYRFQAADAAPRSIEFAYYQREVPEGYEHTLTIYYSPDEGVTWTRLPTQRDPAENQATAKAEQSGLYVLTAGVEIPFYTAGWNLFAYPVPMDLPIAEALASLDGNQIGRGADCCYSTVYGFDAAEPGAPWTVYDRRVGPEQAWANDLQTLRFGQGYWINVTEPITLVLKVGTAAALGQPQVVALANPVSRTPPAVYFGEIQADAAGAAPPELTATVNGAEGCGAATVVYDNTGLGRYIIKVDAADEGPLAECGGPGKQVTLHLGEEVIAENLAWDNARRDPPAALPTVEVATPSDEIRIGGQVEVVYAGANLRRSAGWLEKPEDDVFARVRSGDRGEVIGGPLQADGLRWWQVRFGPVTGWIAETSSAGTRLLQASR